MAQEGSPELTLHSARGRTALVATVAASAMASLDATIVSVGLPRIGDDLDADVGQLQWVLTSYLLSLASLILLAGALGDRWGRRKVFEIGTVWFAGASLLCGLAPSVEVLVAARVLQGIGGALLTPGSLALIQTSFRQEDRAAAIGAWSAFGGVAGAIGPFLGGAVVDGPGWRWAFLLNLPVAAVAVGCSRAAIPESRDPHAAGRVDSLGAAYTIVGLSAATWALTQAGSPAAVLASVALSVVATAGLVLHLRGSASPLIPPALFRDRTFSVVNVGTVFLYASIGLIFFLVPYELQVAAGWTALEAGIALLPATVLMLLLSSRSGELAHRIGPKAQLTLGPLVTAGGLALLTRIGPHPLWWRDVLPGAVLLGSGLVAFVAPLTATVMAAADPDHVNAASGVNNAVARAASLAGLAVVPVVSGLTSARGVAEITDAFRAGLWIATGVAALAAPIMLLGLPGLIRVHRSTARVHCAVAGPQLQPDPRRCPVDPAAASAGDEVAVRTTPAR